MSNLPHQTFDGNGFVAPNGNSVNGHHVETFDIDSIPEIKIPPRVLMGAGPSASYPEALRAMGANTLGHLDPEFLGIMNNVGTMLRRVFKTRNPITGAVPGTGTAGMEAALCNLIEPGDFEEGMTAASAIGDDTLTQGQVSPENFTHGTSAQRMEALRAGMQSADDSVCDRYTQV